MSLAKIEPPDERALCEKLLRESAHTRESMKVVLKRLEALEGRVRKHQKQLTQRQSRISKRPRQ